MLKEKLAKHKKKNQLLIMTMIKMNKKTNDVYLVAYDSLVKNL